MYILQHGPYNTCSTVASLERKKKVEKTERNKITSAARRHHDCHH